MGILTKIKEQAHIAVPMFFLLLLYINNMPVDFNIKVLSPQEIFPWAPKATLKNMLMLISFTIFMVLLETNIGDWQFKYYSVFLMTVLVSWAFYALTVLLKAYDIDIKNGEIVNFEGYITNINTDYWVTALMNSGFATLMIIGIFGMFYLLTNGLGNSNNQYITLIISIPIILCLSVLYLKADGVLGFKDKVINIGTESLKEPLYFWVYPGFVVLLLIWTLFGPGSYGSKKIKYFSDSLSKDSYNFTKYINPYGTLGRDTNHPFLAVFVLLIMAYMFKDKKMGFVIFTILIIICEILYDTFPEFINKWKKISLLSMFILFLIIDSSLSKVSIEGEGKDKEG